MNFKEFNKEVLYVTEEIAQISASDIEWLKRKALANDRRRIRLCFHKNVDDAIHEMLIVHTKDTYVRPHKHLNKSESFYVIEGSADMVIFDEEGGVTQAIPLGEYSSGRKFYYRMASAFYHTLVIHSDFLVFLETTKGPFVRSDTVFASWAPQESDTAGCQKYKQKLTEQMLLNT
jgi:cupin fold WbuC family metalloprotein